jgi:putative DNA primase/helicase
MTFDPKRLAELWRIPWEQGYSVFPLPRGRKRPAGAWKVYQNRRATLGEIERWATADTNVAIVTGHVSGLLVVDLDSAEAVQEAERRGLPLTPRCSSPRGEHVYFQHPGGCVSNGVNLLPGMDVRCDGGYVVAPGSTFVPTAEELAEGRERGEYKWLVPPGSTPLAAPPDWVLDLLKKGATRNAACVREPLSPSGSRAISAAAAAGLDAVRLAPVGGRNDALNRSAFAMAREAANGRVPKEETFEALRETALMAGLGEREVDATLRSAWSAGTTAASQDTSEDGIATEFTNRYAERFLFDHEVGAWFEWDGSSWRRDSTKSAFHALREIARSIPCATNTVRKASTAKGAERMAQADPRHAVTRQVWDRDPFLLGTPVGTVNLRTGVLGAASRADRITKVTSVAPRVGRPETWLRFLTEATGGDEEFLAFLQKVCGYILTGDTREQALWFIYGAGKNGKSVFVNTLQAIAGEYGVNAAMETFTATKGHRHPTDLAMLEGARLVTASETERDKAWDETRIKQLTGGDAITARYMRENFFTFRPTFKLLIVGNHRPALRSVDEATRRRFNIVPFTRTPARPDPFLEKRLVREHPEILQWMIDGCLRWQLEGLSAPSAVAAATAAYFDEQDSVAQWMEQCCLIQNDLSETVTRLFESWTNFCLANGHPPGGVKSLGEALEKRGLRRHRTSRARLFIGIAVADFHLSDECDGSMS